MNVTVESATKNPIDLIGSAAGTSRDRHSPNERRVKNCLKVKHTSILEHVVATFHITGISRACSHQLVRHRLASFVQKSQRYTVISDDKQWFVIPPEIEKSSPYRLIAYLEHMQASYDVYSNAIANGIKPEDARYLLPEATMTDITMTANARELFHFFDLRIDDEAQWEIRYLAEEMKRQLCDYDPDWKKLIDIYYGEDQ